MMTPGGEGTNKGDKEMRELTRAKLELDVGKAIKTRPTPYMGTCAAGVD